MTRATPNVRQNNRAPFLNALHKNYKEESSMDLDEKIDHLFVEAIEYGRQEMALEMIDFINSVTTAGYTEG
jgi:hypothetical protein